MFKVILFAFMLVPSLAFAEYSNPPICGKHDEVIERLKSKFKEVQSNIGLASNGGVVEIYVSKEGKFTIFITNTDLISCLIVAGENWINIKATKIYY